MSWNNSIGIMSDGLWNDPGERFLYFESMGLLGELTFIPVPPAGGPGNVPGGMDPNAMSPLGFWRRTKLRSMDIDPWSDSTMGAPREDFMDELEGQDGKNVKKKKR